MSTVTVVATSPRMVWVYLASLLAAFAFGSFLGAGLADTGLAVVTWLVRKIFPQRPQGGRP